MEKEEKVKAEINRLTLTTLGLEPKIQALLVGPIQEAAFMKITLDELKETINKEGATDLFIQGSSKYVREQPAMKAYSSMIKNYTTLMKNIIDKFPKVEITEGSVMFEGKVYKPGDKMVAFINDDREQMELLDKLFPN